MVHLSIRSARFHGFFLSRDTIARRVVRRLAPEVRQRLGASSDATMRLDEALRGGDPPVVGRIAHDRLLLDCRTVLPAQVGLLAEALSLAAARL